MNNIFFSADTHIGHKNALQYLPNRPFGDSGDIDAHDRWLIDLWQNSMDRGDRLYFAGDLTFYNSDKARRLLETLPAEKYIAIGNHDQSIRSHLNYFCKAAQILEVTIKPSQCSFLQENLQLVICHYPLLDWPNKREGAIMLHGHCHGNMDNYNAKSIDLRYDIGIDGELAQRAGGFIDIQTLYKAIMEKTNGLTPKQYATENY